MKKTIALTMMAGLLAAGCSSPRGGTSDQSDKSYGTGSSDQGSSMTTTNGVSGSTSRDTQNPNSSNPNGSSNQGTSDQGTSPGSSDSNNNQSNP